MALRPDCNIDGLQKEIHSKKGDAKFKLFFWEIDFDRLPGKTKLSDFLDSNVDLRMEYPETYHLANEDLTFPTFSFTKRPIEKFEKFAETASFKPDPPGEVTIYSDEQRKIVVPVPGKTFFNELHINDVDKCSYEVGLRSFLHMCF